MDEKPKKPGRTIVNTRSGMKRNGRCWFCQSGKKFKQCCGKHVGGRPFKLV